MSDVPMPKPVPLPQPNLRPANHADLLVDFLHQLQIDTVFGVPGGAIEPLYDALARSERKGGPRIVTARHESGAAFMADGYHRETGKMGVVCSTTGPGATNLITGVSSAMAEHIPMLVITAQTALPKFGRRALQDSSCTAIDTVAMLKHCTLFNTLISHADQLPAKLIAATMSAHRNPGGPAHISVPSDILRAAAATAQRCHMDLLLNQFAFNDNSSVARLCEKLARVDSLAVYIDGSVGPATASVVKFCELTNTPFVVGLTGKYWVNETHPLYRGVYGFAGHESARSLFCEDVDLLLAVGAAMDELSTSGWDAHLLNTKLVHIDSNLEHFARSSMANLHVGGDINAIFSTLNSFVREQLLRGRRWLCCDAESKANIHGGYAHIQQPEKCLGQSAPVKPQELMYHLSWQLPPDARIFIDAGNVWAWTTHYFCNRSQLGYLRSGMGLGAMAWSIGAAVGSAMANPKVSTLCLVGDGAYLMSAQEITVAVQHRLPVVFMVLNDSAYGMVLHGQRLGGAEAVGWELSPVDYAAMACAMGVQSRVIHSTAELAELDYQALARHPGPTLIDVRLDREEVPPMAQRVRDLCATPGG
jgi:acetolactate synthase-1/2/3 large subunit